MTRVVHCKRERYDIYGGRPSILGNPHPIGFCKICQIKHNRKQAINKYKEYFTEQIQINKKFKEAVLNCKDKVIGCWCKNPYQHVDCHCNIIADYLNKCKYEYEKVTEEF